MNRRQLDESNSDAVDLEKDVFSLNDPLEIAQFLKQIAEQGNRKRSKSPYQSAMSMLTFHINRVGKNLSDSRREVLEQAKAELRKLFNRE